MTRIVITRRWTDPADGVDHRVGAVVDVDPAVAKTKIRGGSARAAAPEPKKRRHVAPIAAATNTPTPPPTDAPEAHVDAHAADHDKEK